jgi:thioredoxin 1
MTTTIIISVLVIIIALYIYKVNKIRKTPMADNHERIIELDEKNFDATINNKIILVDFWAAWCMPCKMLTPVLNELAEELPKDKYIGKVDVEKYPGLSNRFKIRGIPTMILFKNGKEVERIVGLKTKATLKAKIMEA